MSDVCAVAGALRSAIAGLAQDTDELVIEGRAAVRKFVLDADDCWLRMAPIGVQIAGISGKRKSLPCLALAALLGWRRVNLKRFWICQLALMACWSHAKAWHYHRTS